MSLRFSNSTLPLDTSSSASSPMRVDERRDRAVAGAAQRPQLAVDVHVDRRARPSRPPRDDVCTEFELQRGLAVEVLRAERRPDVRRRHLAALVVGVPLHGRG